MLKKLLKYDLKWCYKGLGVFYILSIFFAIIARIFGNFEKTLIVTIINNIFLGIVITMIANILINSLMRNWVRFKTNIYGDESYLTHTLPVTRNKIYLSKIITAIIVLTTSFIVIVISLAIAYLNEDTWIILKNIMERQSILFNCSITNLVIVMIPTIFFEFLFMYMSGILGMIIGHKSNNLKIVKTILIGILIYMIFSSMSVVILYAVGILNSEIMEIFNTSNVSSNSLKQTMIVGIVIYSIYNLVTYFYGNKVLNKGINID